MTVDKTKPTLLISVTMGWAIRNFFQTGVVALLQQHVHVVVLASPTCAQGLHQLGYDQQIEIVSVEPGKEPVRWKLMRQLKKKIYLEGRQSTTEAIWEKYHPRPVYQRVGGKILKSAVRLANPQRLYGALEAADLGFNTSNDLAEVFARLRPALFFATHATTYIEEYLLRNALAAGVRPMFMILSWDHLSSKILLNSIFHSILVWNSHTKHEVLATYPKYRPEQIRVVGIPQYDIYAEKPRWTYAEWCQSYRLNPARRTILFSTMPQVRHNQQHLILEQLLKAIEAGREVPGDFQVLIKCHPFDDFEGYERLLEQSYPVAIHRTTLPPGNEKETWIPDRAEIEASRDALFFSSININIFSTVTIEAAFFDKPVIHIAFDPQPVEGRIPCHEYYNWDHFKPIVDKNASLLVHNFSELFRAVALFSTQPELLAAERRDLVKTYIGCEVGSAASLVAKEILASMPAAL